MMSSVEYLPVPTIRRDVNSLPPITSGVSSMALAPTHRSHDFHPIAVTQPGVGVPAARRHLTIHRHRGELALDAELGQQRLDAQPVGDLHALAVDADLHPVPVRSGPGKRKAAPEIRVRPCRRRVPYAGITPLRFEGSRG